MFTPLTVTDISKIVKIQLDDVNKLLIESGFQLKITDNAIGWITNKGFNPQYGARPVKRVIQKYVLNELSKQLLAGKVEKSSFILIDSEGDGLVFNGL